MKLMLTGLPANAIEENVAEGMRKLGPVENVTVFHEGNADSSWAIVEMPISNERAQKIKEQVNSIWYKGKAINISIMIRA